MILDSRFSILDWLGAVPDPIDWARQAGTLSMQGLLMLAIIFLGSVVIYFHRDQKKIQAANHAENRELQALWMTKMEQERTAMSKERVDRINMLIDLIREDMRMKSDLVNAIANNTKAIERLEEIMKAMARA
jgi:uncharacterized protein HemX